MQLLRGIVFVGLWLFIASLHAQHLDRFKSYHYSTEEGLSQGSVYSMLEDHLGFLWMTTYEGLNRFDGSDFKIYKESRMNPKSLQGNNTVGIVQDSTYNLWIGSEKCLNRYDYNKEIFDQYYTIDAYGDTLNSFHYPIYATDTFLFYANELEGFIKLNYRTEERQVLHPDLNYFRNNSVINSMKIYCSRTLWVRQNRGMLRYNIAENRVDTFLANQVVYCMDIDSSGNAWAITRNKLYIIGDPKSKVIEIQVPDILESDKVQDIHVVNDSICWIGTSYHGILKWNIRNEEVQVFCTRNNEKSRLPIDRVSNIYSKKEDFIWCSTDPQGVVLLQSDDKPFQKYTNVELESQTISLKGIKCFAELHEGEILIGTQFHKILVYDKVKSSFENAIINKALPNEEITFILPSSNDQLWVGTYDGLFKGNMKTGLVEKINFKDTKSEKVNTIWGIVEDKRQNIYFSTDNGIFVIPAGMKKAQKLPIFEHSASGYLYLDDNENLYIPQHNSGFAIINVQNLYDEDGEIVNTLKFKHHFKNEINVKSFHKDKKTNCLWLTTTNGIFKTAFINDSLIVQNYFGQEEGLQSNYVYGIIQCEGEFWFSSNKGLGRINTNGAIDNFNTDEGLQGSEFNTNSFYKDSKGLLYFGGVNGFNSFWPNDIAKEKQRIFSPILSRIQTHNTSYSYPVAEDTHVKIPYFSNHLELSYQLPFFLQKEKLNFAYRLNYGDWINNGTSKNLTFSNLKPGNYNIDVKGFRMDIKEDHTIASFQYEVLKPWYGRWWFLLALFALTGLVFYFFSKRRIDIIKKEENLKSRILELKMQALQSQMNPHFIFNCLNTIDGFIASNHKKEASLFISKFAKLVRHSLQNMRSQKIRLLDEIQLVKSFIGLELIKYENRFEYIEDLRDESVLSQIFTPPLLVQPYIENAIKHGATKASAGGVLKFSGFKRIDRYYLVINDNGPGITDARMNNHSSLGMVITRERLALHNDKNSETIEIDVKTTTEDGTQITIIFPVPLSN